MPGRDPHSIVMGLLPPLYTADMTENGWCRFLEQLSDVMGSDAGAIAILDTQRRPTGIFASGAFSQQLFDEYAAHFAAIDPWPAAFAASGRPLGQHVCSHELISRAHLRKPNITQTCGDRMGIFSIPAAP